MKGLSQYSSPGEGGLLPKAEVRLLGGSLVTGTQAPVVCEERPCPRQSPPRMKEPSQEGLSKDCGSWGPVSDGGLNF